MFPIGGLKKNHYCVYEGKTYYNRFPIYADSDYKVVIRLISVDSTNQQGIALKFCDFDGEVRINGEMIEIPRKNYQDYILRVPKDEDICGMEVTIDIHPIKGYVYFENASALYGSSTFTTGEFSSHYNGFWLEQLSDNSYRFHCNDHEKDEDFNDFIFDLEIGQK